VLGVAANTPMGPEPVVTLSIRTWKTRQEAGPWTPAGIRAVYPRPARREQPAKRGEILGGKRLRPLASGALLEPLHGSTARWGPSPGGGCAGVQVGPRPGGSTGADGSARNGPWVGSRRAADRTGAGHGGSDSADPSNPGSEGRGTVPGPRWRVRPGHPAGPGGRSHKRKHQEPLARHPASVKASSGGTHGAAELDPPLPRPPAVAPRGAAARPGDLGGAAELCAHRWRTDSTGQSSRELD